MNKAELISAISAETQMTKTAVEKGPLTPTSVW